MAVVAFDTLKLADRLQSGGFSAEQARTAALAFADAMSGSELAVKSDLTAVKSELKADIAEVKSELKAEISEVRNELHTTKAELKADIALLSTRMDNMATRIEQQGAALSERIERRHAESDAKIQIVRGEIQSVKNDTLKWIVTTGVVTVVTLGGMIVGAAWAIIRYLPTHG